MTVQDLVTPLSAPSGQFKMAARPMPSRVSLDDKNTYLDYLITQLTVEELASQLPVISGNWIIGEKSDYGPYDVGIGTMCDWYPTHHAHFNSLQAMNLDKSRIKIPLMAAGESLHAIFSNRQPVFPQSLSLSSSFDTDLVYRVGRALGTEARSIGIQITETYGEDYVLVSHMGVAYSSGLSKNGTLSVSDAALPVVKHFGGHGAPTGGLHSNAWAGRGRRELLTETLTPLKAAIDQGGVKGVMMPYTAVDDIPGHIDPLLYKQLDKWGFDGFVISDWWGLRETFTGYLVADSPADAIRQWLNIGGRSLLYDFAPDVIVSSIVELVKNGDVKLATLLKRVRKILEAMYDLGLFHDPYLPEADPNAITLSHIPLAIEAAQRSIRINKIAIVGPFVDLFNYGSYTGPWGANPTGHATTIRHGILNQLAAKDLNVDVFSAWGANSWQYNAQYPIPGYLLSANSSSGGLQATYYHDVDLHHIAFQTIEMPNHDWGVYPPIGLGSNSFGVVWEGELEVPVSCQVDGWIGVGVTPKTTARLYIDGKLVSQSDDSNPGTILREIMSYTYTTEKGTIPPPGGSEFVFTPGSKHKIRIECKVHPNWPRSSAAGVHSRVQLFWNLVDRNSVIGQAKGVASDADLIVLAVGAAWNSDGENGDRATLSLPPDQTKLARTIFELGKPVVLVLEGGRPFAIPELYAQSAAALSTAIANVLFGEFNPGGRLTTSVPYHVGCLPVFYNQRTTKPKSHIPYYLDVPKPVLFLVNNDSQYSFGYGLSYTTFSQDLQSAASTTGGRAQGTFSQGDTLGFLVTIRNTGDVAGSHVPQVR
ncbi:hypothetical protein ACHAPT_013498 [Fusarium lateritium]